MAKKEVTIVGAGISGLTAAITARRMGYEVRVLEKFARAGGAPGGHPTVDSTPLDPALLTRWLGVPIGEPQVGPADCMHIYVFGRQYELHPEYLNLHNVERGPRTSCIDRYLADVARDMGVNIEWNSPVHSQAELAELPPDTIIATGPYTEMFRALRIPYEAAYGYIIRSKYTENGVKSDRRILAAYFDHYTKDYAYIASANGIVFGLIFSRTPIGEEHLEVWRKQLLETEGVTFNFSESLLGVFASKYPNSTRLFYGDKILTGGLAGAQDPGTYFGCHGGAGLRQDRRHRPGGQGPGPGDVRLLQPQLQRDVVRPARRHQLLAHPGAPLLHQPGHVRRQPLRGDGQADGINGFKLMIPGYRLMEKRMEKYEPRVKAMQRTEEGIVA